MTMPQRNLDRTWIYAGKFYGPGHADLPDEVAQAIDAKTATAPEPDHLARIQGVQVEPGNLADALREPGTIAHGAVALRPDDAAPGEQLGGFIGEADTPPAGDLSQQLSAEVIKSLGGAGYTSGGRIRSATDDELLAIEGIGPATLRRLRQIYGTNGG
jgi:predicted flap endonuclease-1-like 5' DNA nuclease